MLGLERGKVRLTDHDPRWISLAQETITRLWDIFGSTATDIQHVGSTAVVGIKAKPIIDIAIAVHDLAAVETLTPALAAAGFLRCPWSTSDQMLFAIGDYTIPQGIQTHYIHVVTAGSTAWRDYINFRDYLNAKPAVAIAYEALKIRLAHEHGCDNGREKYLAGKHDFIVQTLRAASAWSYLGKTVTVAIDRPLGTVHSKHPDIRYPVNYGYIAGERAPDGENLDVYVLGAAEPMTSFVGKVIAIVHRDNDVEDKLVAVPLAVSLSREQIAEQIHFQEQYFNSWIELVTD
ncbi:MAG TPA: hypothetical protein GXZ82_13765 [Firmicutes bacterium]|jgi:GrpB-like predicted nucleotidyltransferase (UPF0157 family)|nr:hypothetical protein [Bacillota bacterium]